MYRLAETIHQLGHLSNLRIPGADQAIQSADDGRQARLSSPDASDADLEDNPKDDIPGDIYFTDFDLEPRG